MLQNNYSRWVYNLFLKIDMDAMILKRNTAITNRHLLRKKEQYRIVQKDE